MGVGGIVDKYANAPTQKIPFYCLCGMRVGNDEYIHSTPIKGTEVIIYFKCPNCGTITKVDADEMLVRVYNMVNHLLQSKADRQKAAVV